jgi:hypothetical protein
LSLIIVLRHNERQHKPKQVRYVYILHVLYKDISWQMFSKKKNTPEKCERNVNFYVYGLLILFSLLCKKKECLQGHFSTEQDVEM